MMAQRSSPSKPTVCLVEYEDETSGGSEISDEETRELPDRSADGSTIFIESSDSTAAEDARDRQSIAVGQKPVEISSSASEDDEEETYQSGDPKHQQVISLDDSSNSDSESRRTPFKKLRKDDDDYRSDQSVEDQPGLEVSEQSTESEDEVEEGQEFSRKPYAIKKDKLSTGMRFFLKQAKHFFTRSHSLQRSGSSVCDSTYDKAEERILCFLGYAKQQIGESQLTPELFGRTEIIESYLDYLKDRRQLSSATISNHICSLLYPLKFQHRSHAPNYHGVPLIAQMRKTATSLQRQADLDRPRTREELKRNNRWLDWDEVLAACKLQRARFDVARGTRQRAREAADLLLISLYCHIPPSRGLEMRTLEIVQERDTIFPFRAADYRNRNVALLKGDGAVTIHMQLYKTRRFTGHDEVQLEKDTELCRLLKQYVVEFRPSLCKVDTEGSFLFVNVKGEPFSSAAYSKHIKQLFLKLTGCQVTINTLRASFVTWAYSQSECDDTMKDSLAAALRHSREQAQTTYDRRTANDKKKRALALTRRKAESEEGQEAEQEVGEADGESEIVLADFVGLVEEESTLHKPSILLGRVHEFLPGNQVSLLWYKRGAGSLYSLHFDGTRWVEDLSALVPVSVKAAKSKPNCYRLCTSLRSIHKAVCGEYRRN